MMNQIRKVIIFLSLFLLSGYFLIDSGRKMMAQQETKVTTTKSQKDTKASSSVNRAVSRATDIAVTLTFTDGAGKPLQGAEFVIQRLRSTGKWVTFNQEAPFKTDSSGMITMTPELVDLMKYYGGGPDNRAFRFRLQSVPAGFGYDIPPAYSGTDNENTANNGQSLAGFVSDRMNISSETTLDQHLRMYDNKAEEKNLVNNPTFYRNAAIANSIPGWNSFVGKKGLPFGATPVKLNPSNPLNSNGWVHFEDMPIAEWNDLNEWSYEADVNTRSPYSLSKIKPEGNYLGLLEVSEYNPVNREFYLSSSSTTATDKEKELLFVFGQTVPVKPDTSYKFGLSYHLPSGLPEQAGSIEVRFFDGKRVSGPSGTSKMTSADDGKWHDLYTEYKTPSTSDQLTISLRTIFPVNKRSWASIKNVWMEEGSGDAVGEGDPQKVTVNYYQDGVLKETTTIPSGNLGRSWSAPLKVYDGFDLDSAKLDGAEVPTSSEAPVEGIFKTTEQTVDYYFKKQHDYKLVADPIDWGKQFVGTSAPTSDLFSDKVYVYDGDTKVETLKSNFTLTVKNYNNSIAGPKTFDVTVQSTADLNEKYPGLVNKDTAMAVLNVSFYTELKATAVAQTFFEKTEQPTAEKRKEWVKDVTVNGKAVGSDYTVDLITTWDSSQAIDKDYQVKVTSGELSETFIVKVTYTPIGNLIVDIPSVLDFRDVYLRKGKEQVVRRKNDKWALSVDDQRHVSYQKGWELSVKLEKSFALETADQKNPLDDILIYKGDSSSVPEVLKQGEKHEILSKSTGVSGVTKVDWSPDAGFLLKIDRGKSRDIQEGNYTAVLEFTLEDTP